MPDLFLQFRRYSLSQPVLVISLVRRRTPHIKFVTAFDVGLGWLRFGKTLTDDPIVNVASSLWRHRAGQSKADGPQQYRAHLATARWKTICAKWPRSERIIRSTLYCVGHGRVVNASTGTQSSKIQDVGIDGFELNFGCPHGMSERGMGSAVGPGTPITQR